MANPAGQRFEQIVLPHLDDGYALARWLTGSAHDAEDVVQDACLKALAALDRQTVGNPRAWLLTIVRNTAMTWIARNRPRHLVLVEDLTSIEANAPASAATSEDAEAALIARADSDELHQAIAALPTAFRETLVLHDINGLSYREVAEITAVPLGTVMSRLARARRLLGERLLAGQRTRGVA